MKIIAAALAAIALTACAPTAKEYGISITDAQISQFQIGKATENDVLAAFGKPSATQSSTAGSKLIYSHVRTNSNLNYLVPTASKTSLEQRSVIFEFDGTGTLKDIHISNTSI